MRWLDAAPRRAAPKGHETFISRAASTSSHRLLQRRLLSAHTAQNDMELNYKLEGDGEETIVLINGLADDLETWALQMDDFLAAGFRVLRFDNRGIGASSKPVGPYSSRMLAGDAKALVDHLGVTDFHL